MGYFKKRGKPRQYWIRFNPSSEQYIISVWELGCVEWVDIACSNSSTDDLALLLEVAALDAKVRGYGDNYEITELI